MDAIVRAAMEKWPRVPAVFGWLMLTARGEWQIKGEVVSHAAMIDFFNRNYTRDHLGRYYVQNGPQKVYVDLEAAPLVLRRGENDWYTVPFQEDDHIRTLYFADTGVVFAEIAGELAVLHDQDLANVIDRVLPNWEGDLKQLPDFVELYQQTLPLVVVSYPVLLSYYGIQAKPKPEHI